MAELAASLLKKIVRQSRPRHTELPVLVRRRPAPPSSCPARTGDLGAARSVPAAESYKDVFNASGYQSPEPGISYADSVTAFEMVRGGRVDVVVLGAYQVDAEGSFANWQTDGMVGGGIGGAMDLVASGRTVMVMMEHRDSRDRPKVVQRCSYALTGKACVDILVDRSGAVPPQGREADS